MKVHLEHYVAPFWIGILPHEREASQSLRLTITVTCYDPGPVAEHLDRSFDYRALLDVLASLQTRHIDLLETLTEDIAMACFDASPLVQSLTLRVDKLDLLPDPATIGIERTLDRAFAAQPGE